jgi:fatty-acyl-CoA synthase
LEFEDLLSRGDESFDLRMCQDEFDAMTLNYTSGTTGNILIENASIE